MPSDNHKTIRTLFFGTHPKQFNGYSKVVYEITKCMSKHTRIEFIVYGFQNFYDNTNHRKDLPSNVVIYDASANEPEPKHLGFGFTEVRAYVNKCKPDVCVVYNDMLVIHQIVGQLQLARKEDKLDFKIIAYIDQVYLNQKKEYIDYVNANCDYAMMFTSFWEKNILDQGINLPSGYLVHGFNPQSYFPVPKPLARAFYGIPENQFVIMNLNRNQPRKRWDTCLKAFAEIVARYPNEPIKLMIATALQGGWNLMEIYERELKKRNVTLQVGMDHLIIIDNPQRVTDEETNILYNVADIGINTCDGEGYGLCNFEQAAIGIPQIVPRIGGFMEYLDDDSALLIDPKMAYYVDHSRDMVCGEALLCEYMDFVEAIETYYFNKELRQKHGENARARIVKNYGWDVVTKKLADIIKEVCGVKKLTVVEDVEDLEEEVERIDIETLTTLGIDVTAKEVVEETETPITVSQVSVKAVGANDKAEKKKQRDILRLQKKLDKLKQT